MSEQQLVRRVDGYFSALGPRVRSLACQLPLAVAMAVVVLASPASWQGLFSDPVFLFAVALHTLALLACVVVPWERLGRLATLMIPLLDLIAIGFSGSPGGLSSVGVLSILPVVWISSSGLPTAACLSISFFGPLLAVLPWIPANAAGPDRIAALLLLPGTALAVSVALRFARLRVHQEQRRIQAQEAQLHALLAASRERERLLKTILDTVDVGIVAVNAAGSRLLTNSWQTALEESATPAGAAKGTDESRLLLTGQDPETPLAPERRPLRRAASGETFADYLVRFGEPPGSRVVSTGARPLRDDDGGFCGSVVVFTEVTGLVEALAVRDDIVSTVSHEFRTPLTSIIGNLDLVLGDSAELSTTTERRVEVAQRNAERLLALVSDLLMSATATVYVHPRRTDLTSLVEASLGSAQAHAHASRVLLTMDLPDPLWADVDPLRISQALDNLVSNAIKYSPGGGSVHVSASTAEGLVLLHVEDAGMGMTASDAERIFTRFFRSPAVREGPIPGAGLGLSITKAIIEGHGGSLSCTTRPGCGSTFTMVLPAEAAPPAF
ncbi:MULTISPECIES: PAS domain-containing sensor histidine kinase [Micrococcaceae]|uniref:sensor histidine kinase n=1 Tax=Micrococcaceae TaxID=1268 RepID=UPI001CFFE41D|nr:MULTISPECIES: PAS domain-containing sensor histidine kinase [Micrococcaceae]MCB5282099.1 Sensor histidine kinase YycG [Arthrobacter sp. ES1]MDJ0352825.1 ATP-binding protein [Pseudarthrobacter sp. PH31-O2]WGZ78656.1 ATP-binding protein [Arthrobacter sp. EM1]